MTRKFQTTRWSLVLAARAGTTPQSREALASLCEAYWDPLYAFVRRQGYRVEEARDLTQAYFLRLLEKNYLRDVRPEGGRFRSFLLASLRHFLANESERARALKRGGGRQAIPLDLEDAERRYLAEISDGTTAERVFEKRWALTVIDRVLDTLRGEFEADGKLAHFQRLKMFLTGEGRMPYRQVAAELEMTETAVKVAVHRLRRRFGQVLRAEVADAVAGPDEIDGEIRYLLSVIGDRPPAGG